MTPYYLLAGSVLAHVIWNLLARRQQPSGDFLWWAAFGYCVLACPFLLHPALRDPTILLCLLITGLLNGTYFLCLARAYESAPVTVVYPLARSSPLLLAVVEVAILGIAIDAQGILAISICVGGILLLSLTSIGKLGRRGSVWALLAACSTVGYSLSDKRAAMAGLDSIPAGLGYVCGTYAIALLVLTAQRKLAGGPWIPRRTPWLPTLVASVCVGVAYALVIGALRYLPASVTVAWTNAGIVIGVLIAIAWLKEREQLPLRLTSVAITVTGLILLAL